MSTATSQHRPDIVLLVVGTMYSAVAGPCASNLLLVRVTNTGDAMLLSSSLFLKGVCKTVWTP